MNSVIIKTMRVKVPEEIKCTNYLTDHEPRFKHKLRKKPLRHLVLHETAGNTAIGCKNTLLKKGYGVHLILDRKGKLSCHGDLFLDVMAHANQLNKTSIGVEVVNPYAPKLNRLKVSQTVNAKWWTWCPDKKNRKYVLPSLAQLKTLRVIVPWLCEQLSIPLYFPTWFLNSKQRRIKNWRLRAKPEAGIVAHQDFSKHADGRYLLEDLILYLLEKGEIQR